MRISWLPVPPKMRKQTLLICSNFADHGIRLLYWWHFSQVWYDVFFCSDISSTNCMLLSGPLIAYCCQLRDHPIARIWAIFGKLRGGHVLLLVVYYNGVYYAPTLMWDEKSMMNCHYICTWIVCRATCDVAVLVWTTGYNWVGNISTWFSWLCVWISGTTVPVLPPGAKKIQIILLCEK
jgi:hypothetical protein